MEFIDDMERVLRYVWEKHHIYPNLVDHTEFTPHLMYADWLDEHNEPVLAARVRKEVEHSRSGRPLSRVHLGDSFPTTDYVLHAIRTGHPNPTVRALAHQTGVGHPPDPELLNLLFHSQKHSDLDAAAFLSPEDPHQSHSAHPTLKRLSGTQYSTSGLEPKVVRGEVYLLDHDLSDMPTTHPHWGGPQIRFTSPVGDRAELAALEAHANGLLRERQAVGHTV